jgi:hypothetical protein
MKNRDPLTIEATETPQYSTHPAFSAERTTPQALQEG